MLIIDMQMPKFCIWRDDKNEPHRCPLLNEDDNCVLQDSNIWMGWNEQYAHCPIKGVLPEEHGDLIDRDKLKRAFCNHCDGRDTMNGEPNCTEPCFDLGLMDCMPVIIAAERKDDEQIH